ncbi:unnamed protein product [Parnassius apollo]|uniref:(apollo) hypothetical protein n=1 Tax=Parnassius apollo TaxID=110799 RepID=A0A8S3WFI9_PARAO|nr:unnamed protein product [Parnassius apollo]
MGQGVLQRLMVPEPHSSSDFKVADAVDECLHQVPFNEYRYRPIVVTSDKENGTNNSPTLFEGSSSVSFSTDCEDSKIADLSVNVKIVEIREN